MTPFNPIRDVPTVSGYGSGDVLVVFGEVFGRGYVNGLIDAAKNIGMTVFFGTGGRREADGSLRKLTEAEIVEKGHAPIINVPLEAGFDKEDTGDGRSLAQLLTEMGKDWETKDLDFDAIETARQAGEARFRAQVADFMQVLGPQIPSGANVLFAHTMAGGIPASKRVLSVSNRIFKGTGNRFQESQAFWDSAMGRACAISFDEVTANTLAHLVSVSAPLRSELEAKGSTVNYVAYGYHGTECLIDGAYEWQTYAPYLQGFAKMKLEAAAAAARAEGVNVSVYNAPEILTNSSGVFVGVELPLYRLLAALEHETQSQPLAMQVRQNCAARLSDGAASLDEVETILDRYHGAAESQYTREFAAWPQHNTQGQMDLMIDSALRLRGLHNDKDDLMTGYLSQLVFSACGYIMLHQSWTAESSAYWMGHDVVAKTLAVTGLPG